VTAKHLLVGVLVCDKCDKSMRIGYHRGGVRKDRHYRCPDGHIARPADTLEHILSTAVLERLRQDDAHSLLLTANEMDLGLLRDKATKLRARRTVLGVQFGKGNLPADVFELSLDEIREELDAVEKTLDRATQGDPLGPLLAADDVQEAWDAMETDFKRVVFQNLVQVRLKPVGRGYRNGLDPENMEITWLRG
jgi:hypothetical protein